MVEEEPLLRLMPLAAEAVRVSLAKLFEPIEIRLVETTIGSVAVDAPAPGLHVGFHIGSWHGARIVMLVDNRDAARIGDVMLNRESSGQAPDERALEAITELANIAASSFLSRIASLARVRLMLSTPDLRREPLQLNPAGTPHLTVARYELKLADGPARFRLAALPETRLMDAIRTATRRINSSAA